MTSLKLNKNWADVIIILGCEFKKDNIGKQTKQRVKQGVKLYKKGLAKNIIMAAGTKRKNYLSYYMKKYAIKLGVPSKNIFTEENSKDTIGNAIFSKEIVLKKKWKNIILVTSDYHIERSLFIFHHVFGPSYNIIASDSKTSFLHKIMHNRFTKEKEEYIFAKTLFSGIKPGNHKEIKKRLLKTPKYL
jgi:uncharacterized SAM-binding protein YcdF (DUF218 family)